MKLVCLVFKTDRICRYRRETALPALLLLPSLDPANSHEIMLNKKEENSLWLTDESSLLDRNCGNFAAASFFYMRSRQWTWPKATDKKAALVNMVNYGEKPKFTQNPNQCFFFYSFDYCIVCFRKNVLRNICKESQCENVDQNK